MKAIISKIIDQKRKNGNFILKPEQQELLKTFLNFDMKEDWIDGKDLTKIGKLIHTHSKNVMDTENDVLNKVRVWSIESLESDKIDRIRGYKYEESEDRAEIEEAFKAYSQLSPIADQIKLIRETRAMVNGKLPKAERERREREEIKGNLDPQLKDALDQTTARFRQIIKDHFIAYYTRKVERAIEFHAKPEPAQGEYKDIEQRRIYGQWRKTRSYFDEVVTSATKEGVYTYKTAKQLVEMAEWIADTQSQSFFFKMADKMGGMINGTNLIEVKEAISHSNPFESSMVFTFQEDTQFTIINKIVRNTSPLGTPFYQYPCTFHDAKVQGEKVNAPNEYSVKKAFNEVYGMAICLNNL